MNKKLAFLAVASFVFIIVGGINSTMLYGSQYLLSQQGYTYNTTDWWNYSWYKRVPINLSVSSGTAPSRYQVLLNITYDSDMNNNFSDLRFVNYSDNSTGFDYWIENKSDGNWANVWVEVRDTITTTNRTLAWMYHNNSAVGNSSNGTNTFDFFDDFDSFNASKWSATGSYSVSSSQLTITTGAVYSDSTVASQPGLISFTVVLLSMITPSNISNKFIYLK